ncbi:MAG: (Fe-S)-binding protein [Deltaproteobacteria bacterium]|nr:(Fe-S)-binding protein [Deltaproteobacteria bacterium]
MKSTDSATGHCTYCPRLCRHACPVETASGREALTPKAKMQTAGELSGKNVALDREDVEVLWGCSHCGACEDECLHHNPVGQTLYAARAHVADLGLTPEPMHAAAKRFSAFGNALGVSLAEAQLAIHDDTRAFAGAPALILGCHALGDPSGLAALAYDLARRIRPDVWLPLYRDPNGARAICCGRTLNEAGYRTTLEKHRAKMNDALAHSTEWWILETTCFEDFVAMADAHPNKPRVRTFAEALAASDLKPKRRLSSITLHLGCGVRRHAKGEEALVALAQRASDDVRIPPADMPFSGCCGGRGGIQEVMPKVAREMGEGRRQELEEFKSEEAVHFSTCCGSQLEKTAVHLLSLFA